MALLSLARMAVASSAEPSWRGQAVRAMANAVFARRGEDGASNPASEAVANTAVAGLATLASKGASGSGWARARETLAAPEGAVDVEALLAHLAPPEPAAAERSAALLEFAPAIRSAA
jgi:hypothetical protein